MAEEHNRIHSYPSFSKREILARAELRREQFYNLVIKAIDALPPDFKEKMENVDVVVADWPSVAQLAKTNTRNRFSLLGLYEGVPQTRRGRYYGMVLPDKITVFRKPIEARCRSWEEVENEIIRVVRHEIAHHFGTDEPKLREIEGNQRKKDRW